jgi:hypothetical protein
VTEIDWLAIIQQGKSAAFTVIPNNDYHIKVEEPTAVMSSTGKPMIKFRCRVQSGPHARSSLLTQQVLTADNPQAVAIFLRFLAAFGVDEQWLTSLGKSQDLSPIARVLDGREAVATVGQREWQGEMRNEVVRFKPMTAGQPVPGAPGGMPVLPGMTPNRVQDGVLPGYGTPQPTAHAVQDTPPTRVAQDVPVTQPAAMPQPTAPAQPAPQPVAAAPQPQPTSAPPVAPAAPPQQPPVNPTPPPQAPAATDGLPPGMDAAQFAAFQAWQAQQMANAQANAGAAPEPQPVPQPDVPADPSVDQPALPY